MKSLNYLIIVLTSFILLACGPDNSAKAKLFEEQRSALEKAKGVEKTVQQQTQQLQQNLEQQSEQSQQSQ